MSNENIAAEITRMAAIVVDIFDGTEDDETIAAAMPKMHDAGFRPSDFITPTRSTTLAIGHFVTIERNAEAAK